MKNLAHALTAYLILAPTFALAQSAPKSPMLHRTPAFASWTITYTHNGSGEKPASAGASRVPANAIHTRTVTKTEKTYWIQTQLESGQQTETWIFDGTQLQTTADGSAIVLVPPPTADSPEPSHLHYDKSEFEELSWITSGNFKGTEMYQGNPAYRFEATKSGAHLSALLAVESQLPLYFSDGEQTCTYSYNPPPAALLIPPKRFSDVLAVHKRGAEALKYRPSPP